MKSIIHNFISNLDIKALKKSNVIMWSIPVVSFGNLGDSKIATLGLNPSNCEFVDNLGNELVGSKRRFPTLRSMGRSNWQSCGPNELDSIVKSCEQYFEVNPYDRWFKRLDFLISSTGYSYYSPKKRACHLDLVPFATSCKWGELSKQQQNMLLFSCRELLGNLIAQSSIKLLVLNGRAVVEGFKNVSDVEFSESLVKDWSISRANRDPVKGIAYTGYARKIGNIRLKRPLKVLGFNHNIQSSFGVTKEIQTSIRSWIGDQYSL